MSFNADKQVAHVIHWARDFLVGTEGKPLVIGISGGKDSTITAAALCEAVGPQRILGVLLPNGRQKDKPTAVAVCNHLGIQFVDVNIFPMYQAMLRAVKECAPNFKNEPFNDVVTSNAPCRCRTATLYTIANQLHGRVVNTCNMSESYVGYDTKWGDQCGDFNLFQDYTATEVKAMGYSLGVDKRFIEKAPDDGMCGQTDEDRWGFTYAYLDAWLRSTRGHENETDRKIIQMHQVAMHKLLAVKLPHPQYLPEGHRLIEFWHMNKETEVYEPCNIEGEVLWHNLP